MRTEEVPVARNDSMRVQAPATSPLAGLPVALGGAAASLALLAAAATLLYLRSSKARRASSE